MAEDKILKCKECGQQFTFTVGEQEFYTQKGFTNEPARCAPCRRARKKERTAMSSAPFQERPSFGGFSYRSSYDRGQY
ncbi:MAG TPA: cytochrome C551 [Armatimonadetes bacterium]|jgi:hypothetical protein|nr:cytochrome C551 [Armatimonadota bacterium]